ncbi:MAG: hypothetical protein FIB01_11690 [Gemmatimonadetes bacterium]|nr:hypothetical protein [Gemmatimonadota bacterium]
MTMAVFAGIHGMNFQHMPELGRQLGQAFALGLMLAIGGALSCSFRRRDLIWVPPRRRRSEAVHS